MPNTNKRENLDFVVILVAATCALVLAVYWNYTHPHAVVRYDCSIAEISPDYPIAVKEQCRRLRAENILQKPK